MPKPATLTPYTKAELDEIRDQLSELDKIAIVARERGEPRSNMMKRLKLSGMTTYQRTVTLLVPIVDAPKKGAA